VNDTSGAHEGEVTAIVTASLTPTTMPATSGPIALPSPPSMTTAKTTPTHPYICDGLMLLDSAMQMPATPVRAAQVPASRKPLRCWSMPNAAATGASCADARNARPRSVRCITYHAAPVASTAAPSVINSGAGRNSVPMRSLAAP
jgi:hypothetical protein